MSFWIPKIIEKPKNHENNNGNYGTRGRHRLFSVCSVSSVVKCYLRGLHGTSAGVYGLCTWSTLALYSEYMNVVLAVHGLCTAAEGRRM